MIKHLSEKTELSDSDKKAIMELWNQEYPAIIEHKSLTQFKDTLSKLFNQNHLVIKDDSTIIAWGCTFDREDQRWFILIISSSHHRKGLGRELLSIMKQREEELNGWVIKSDEYLKRDATAYISPLNFYMKNGFTTTQRFSNFSGMKTQHIQWRE